MSRPLKIVAFNITIINKQYIQDYWKLKSDTWRVEGNEKVCERKKKWK